MVEIEANGIDDVLGQTVEIDRVRDFDDGFVTVAISGRPTSCVFFITDRNVCVTVVGTVPYIPRVRFDAAKWGLRSDG